MYILLPLEKFIMVVTNSSLANLFVKLGYPPFQLFGLSES